MIDELVKTIRLHLSERLTSPLLGAFIVSWSAWNFRTLMVIFSNERVTEKFRLIDHVLYADTWHFWGCGLIFPIATTLLYIFGYPYPAKKVYSYTRKQQQEILAIRRKIEDETPLTIEDSRRIRSELARAQDAYYEELAKRDAEIDALKLRLSTATNPIADETNSKLSSESSSPSLEPNHELLEMLKLVEGFDGRVEETIAISAAKMPKVEAEFYLGELVRLRLLRRDQNRASGKFYYSFTHEGRAALIASRQFDAE